MATLLIGPTGQNPHYAMGENQYARLTGAQTAVLVAHGAGNVHTVVVGVAGTLLKLYDVATGGTTDDTTEIATVDISQATRETLTLDVAFSKGLTAIVTGASADLTVSFRQAQTVSPRTFGTELDGNDHRTTGTSSDITAGT